MPFYLKIALRYLRAKKSTNAINVISWITVTTMAFGTFAMITLMSVFNGFESLVGDMFNVFYSDLRVGPEKGKYLVLTEEQRAALQDIDGVELVSVVLEEDALLEYGEEQFVATVKGVERQYLDVIALDERFLVSGRLALNRGDEPLALLGAGVRNGLGIDMSNPFLQVKVSIPRRNASISGFENAFNMAPIAPSGDFNIQQEFDERYVLVPLAFVQQLRATDNEFTGVEIKLGEDADIRSVRAGIDAIIPGSATKNRYEQNATLYNVMRTEKWVFFAILTLILMIVAFSITGTLSMLIVDKKKDIAVLRALGASGRVINRIFLAEGVLMSFRGAAFGILAATAVCLAQQYIGIIPLPGHTFVVEHYPVKMEPGDYAATVAVIFLISLSASYLPTIRASRNFRLSDMMRAD